MEGFVLQFSNVCLVTV